jgi:hypothetical protein
MHRVPAKLLAAALLGIMALLMIGPAWQDSATVDETSHLADGYLHWRGARTRMGTDDHPPLGQMVESAPLLFMDVKYSDIAQAMLRGELSYPWTLTWKTEVRSVQGLLEPGCSRQYVGIPPLGDVMVQWRCPNTHPFNSWYYWGSPEGQMFGKVFVYGVTNFSLPGNKVRLDPVNDGDAMLFAGRMAQIAVTLLTGLMIFLWTRRATNQDGAALIALALWTFQPTALAHGHLTDTDMGITFGFALASYAFARFLEQPSLKAAALSGAATGTALMLKFTALILAPIYAVMLVIVWKKLKVQMPLLWKMSAAFLLAGWAVVLAVYFPQWAPAPPASQAEMAVLNIPGWFTWLRPVLVPPGFFKGIALTLGHARSGGEAYLFGQWSPKGWWYYFPMALLLKSPVAFVVLMVGGMFMFLRQARSAGLLEQSAWLAATVYLASAMGSGVNIGVRHLLPMLPLLSVGIGCAAARLVDRRLTLAVKALLVWQALSVLLAYPLYIQFFSEAVGGARNGYKYLIDSNFDWGQDAKRLKAFLDEHQIDHIYLDYFGTAFSIDYLKIPNTRVTAETAKQIQHGTLVVSVSQLVRPEWGWLRQSREPSARVAHTLFVYQFP